MTVVFYVDPELARDPDGVDVNTITLSYTFVSKREPQGRSRKVRLWIGRGKSRLGNTVPDAHRQG
jgi:hypothetical protein